MTYVPKLIRLAIILAVFAAGMVAAVLIATVAGAQTSSVTIDTPAAEVPPGYVPEAELDEALATLALVRDRLAEKRAALHRTKAKLHRAMKWKRHHKRRANRLYRTLHPQPAAWLAGARCVHSREGSWTDPNEPYWGGMQMDRSFMAAYGRRWYYALGTADHWRPSVQLLVAWRGYLARGGWNAWPNTAAACGLPLFV